MKANLKSINKARKFSEEFKKSIVAEFEKGNLSVLQLSRLHSIHFQTIYNWIYKFSTFNEKGYRIVEMEDSTSKKLKDQEIRIRELERAVGQKQLKIDYLEKLIEIAGDDLGMDLKKNSCTKLSSGTPKTGHR
ncbi:transposase [Anditalea andensis]|uniref:Transposase n=1 Tax=Anditalea andensis TaxID=1048983 RepID=A0A074LJ25_9BACT|nr:transposase [Anditalea andensis]KEO73812.1 transposase [Anditalea andensis]